MTRSQARETARDILEIIPLVMRTVAAELRAAGEMSAPAHFGLLSILSVRPRMLTDLASLQGVSLPTMSNSISAMAERGWVRRVAPDGDRRVVMIEATATGRAALERVSRCAEAHLAEVLAPLDVTGRKRLHGGLGVLRKIFSATPPTGGPVSRKSHRTTGRRKAYVSEGVKQP
jgi:DNA-binding MarR family transcriptional regulator